MLLKMNLLCIALFLASITNSSANTAASEADRLAPLPHREPRGDAAPVGVEPPRALQRRSRGSVDGSEPRNLDTGTRPATPRRPGARRPSATEGVGRRSTSTQGGPERRRAPSLGRRSTGSDSPPPLEGEYGTPAGSPHSHRSPSPPGQGSRASDSPPPLEGEYGTPAGSPHSHRSPSPPGPGSRASDSPPPLEGEYGTPAGSPHSHRSPSPSGHGSRGSDSPPPLEGEYGTPTGSPRAPGSPPPLPVPPPVRTGRGSPARSRNTDTIMASSPPDRGSPRDRGSPHAGSSASSQHSDPSPPPLPSERRSTPRRGEHRDWPSTEAWLTHELGATASERRRYRRNPTACAHVRSEGRRQVVRPDEVIHANYRQAKRTFVFPNMAHSYAAQFESGYDLVLGHFRATVPRGRGRGWAWKGPAALDADADRFLRLVRERLRWDVPPTHLRLFAHPELERMALRLEKRMNTKWGIHAGWRRLFPCPGADLRNPDDRRRTNVVMTHYPGLYEHIQMKKAWWTEAAWRRRRHQGPGARPSSGAGSSSSERSMADSSPRSESPGHAPRQRQRLIHDTLPHVARNQMERRP